MRIAFFFLLASLCLFTSCQQDTDLVLNDTIVHTRDAASLTATLTSGNSQSTYPCVKIQTQLGISGGITSNVFSTKTSYTSYNSDQVLLSEKNNKLKITYFANGSPIYLFGKTSCLISMVNGQLKGVVNPGSITITSTSIIGEENDGL